MKHAPLMLACLLAQSGGASAPAPCEAKLQLQQQEQLLTVTGLCRSLLSGPARYRYQLLVVRQGAGGRSQNSQGGEFTLAAGQETVLSRVRLNAAPHDRYSAVLRVFDESGQAVALDSTAR